MTGYWFARYRPSPLPQNTSRGLVVVSWQGGVVIAGFVASLVVGAGLFVVGMLTNEIALGVALWVCCVIIGASTFIWASVARCDPKMSAYEYIAERQPRRAAGPSNQELSN